MIAYPLAVGGSTTRVLEAGAGDETVVLVHGVGGSAARWRRNLDALAQGGLHVYALDLPGHGFAEKGDAREHSVPAYARFLRAFLDGLDLERPVLVGTSMGGHVSALLTCDDPGRVRALVLVGGTGLVPMGLERRTALQQRMAVTTRESIEHRLRNLVFDPALVTGAWVEEEFRVNNSPGAVEAFTALGAYFGERVDDDLVGERLAALPGRPPMLLVWGEGDRQIPPEMGRAAQELLPGTPLVLIEKAAHSLYLEQPGEFNRTLREFVAGLPPR